MNSGRTLSEDVLLCVFDHLILHGIDHSEADLSSAQQLHNSLSLVSRAVHGLVRRVRYRSLFVPTPASAQRLLQQPDKTLHTVIRQEMHTITLGRSVGSTDDAVAGEAFERLVAVLGGAGSRVKQARAIGLRIGAGCFTPFARRECGRLVSHTLA